MVILSFKYTITVYSMIDPH